LASALLGRVQVICLVSSIHTQDEEEEEEEEEERGPRDEEGSV
jgi:hypothetical protein